MIIIYYDEELGYDERKDLKRNTRGFYMTIAVSVVFFISLILFDYYFLNTIENLFRRIVVLIYSIITMIELPFIDWFYYLVFVKDMKKRVAEYEKRLSERPKDINDESTWKERGFTDEQIASLKFRKLASKTNGAFLLTAEELERIDHGDFPFLTDDEIREKQKQGPLYHEHNGIIDDIESDSLNEDVNKEDNESS